MKTPKQNLVMARKFLDLLGRAENFTFQTFDESPKKQRNLARIYHGKLEQHAETLIRQQSEGAGVFVTVNETDGKGRAAGNIVRVRALFVDLDGSPLEPVTKHVIQPSITVESSNKRFHAYWLTDECPLAEFKPAQQRLSSQFGGDRSVCDLPRVMRLPGFLHQKAEPFLTHIIFPD